jgi:hypothetical protein
LKPDDVSVESLRALSIGGILLSSTTLWPMLERLARHGHRVATVFRPVRARASEPVSAHARATVGDAKVGLP